MQGDETMKRTYFMAGSAACVASVALMLIPETAFAQRGEGKGRGGGGGRSGNVSRGDSGRGGGSSNRGGQSRQGNVTRSQPSPSRQGNVTRSQPSRQVTPSNRSDAPAISPNITNRDSRNRTEDLQRRIESTPSRNLNQTPSGVVTRPERDRDTQNRDVQNRDVQNRDVQNRDIQNRDDRNRDGRDRTNDGIVTRPDRDGDRGDRNRNDGNRNDWNNWNRNGNDRDRDWADVNRNWNNWNRDRNDWDRDRNDWDRNNWSRNRWSNPYAGWNWGTPNYWNRYYSNGYSGNPFFGYGGYNRYPYYGYGGYGLSGWLPGIGIGLGIGRLFGGGYGYGGYGGYGRYGYGYPGYYDGNYYTGYRGDYVDNSTTVVEEQPVEAEVAADTDFLASARSAFESGDYVRAQRFANHAVIDDPQNAKAHEMMALAMFAQGNFAGSAEATHATVALGSLADWPTLYGYYNDRGKYEEHFNALKQFAAEKPQAPEGHFLLGVHHLMMSHEDSARDSFSRYLKLVDHQDPIGIKLFGQAGGDVDALPKPTAPPPSAEGQRPSVEGTEG
jgi:hypothetical protein